MEKTKSEPTLVHKQTANLLEEESSSFLEPILSLFLPRRCVICGGRLSVAHRCICTGCLSTFAHPTILDPEDNEAVRRLWGELPVKSGVALSYYHRDSQEKKLFEAMKYRGRIDVCQSMGKLLATTFSELSFFSTIDAIVPIPLSRQRKQWRGYNQSEHIARGISQVTGKPIFTNILVRHIDNETQTHKSATERSENVKGVFSVTKPSRLDGQHILVVDDVITTGATLLSAITTLSQACPNSTFSIACIALTHE